MEDARSGRDFSLVLSLLPLNEQVLAQYLMKVAEIRSLSSEDIKVKLDELYKNEVLVSLKVASKDYKNTAELGLIKKTIARLLTILRERQGVSS